MYFRWNSDTSYDSETDKESKRPPPSKPPGGRRRPAKTTRKPKLRIRNRAYSDSSESSYESEDDSNRRYNFLANIQISSFKV